MRLLEESELEEQLDRCAKLAQAVQMFANAVVENLSYVEEWLRVLEFRLRYAGEVGDNED